MSYGSRVVAVATVGAVIALPLAAQQEKPTFSTAVAMVRLHVAVLDRNGNPIEGLGLADFEIHEQGLRQKPVYVFRPEDTPVEVVVVLDLSRSMRDSLDDAHRAVSELALALRGDDCLIVIPFAQRPAVSPWIPGGGSVPPLGKAAIGSRRETALFDAILVAQLALTARRADALASEFGMAKVSDAADSCVRARLDPAATYRQLLVIVSDGLDSVSVTPWSAVMSNALELAIPTVSMFAGRDPDRDFTTGSNLSIWPRLSMERLHALAAASGGLFEKVRSGSYSELFKRVVTLLRGTYVVTFTRTAASMGSSDVWRQVSVRVPEYDAVVLAPDGYYVEASISSRARVASAAAKTLAKSGNLDAAVGLLEESTRQVPNSWEAQIELSHVRELQKRSADALEHALRASRLRPGVGHGIAARIAINLGRYDTAIEQLVRAHQAGDDVGTLLDTLLAQQPPQDPVTLQQRLVAPRVFLEPTISNTVESFLLVRRIDATMARIVSDAPMVGLVTNPAHARYIVWFDLDSSDRRSRPLKGRLRVNDAADPGRPLPSWSGEPDTPLGRLRLRSLENWRVEIPSIVSEAQLREALAPALAQLSQWLHRREDER